MRKKAAHIFDDASVNYCSSWRATCTSSFLRVTGNTNFDTTSHHVPPSKEADKTMIAAAKKTFPRPKRWTT
jgi:hypothetical protein